MAVKNGIYYNRRQNPFTNANIPKKIKSDEDYTPVTAHLDYSINQGVGVVIAELPEVPDLTQSVRIWIIDGSTISADYEHDPTSDSIPNANHFMTALPDSDRPNLIKLPSNVVGKQVGFEYYGLGQVICAEDYMNFKAQSIELTGEFSSGGNIDIAGTVIGRNGLYTPKTMQCLKSLSSEVETNNINAQQATIPQFNGSVDISENLSCKQLQVEKCNIYSGKFKCYYNEVIFSAYIHNITFPIVNWSKHDSDKTLIYVVAYTWADGRTDQDEVIDLYRGPLRYFLAHIQEFPAPSFRKLAGTHARACYYITELS